ncbi:MAG: PD40 domain-containing protein [Chloroflexi bacterium]|nr:PD40 domain-containing protein [Chloroflexota bacterium]
MNQPSFAICGRLFALLCCASIGVIVAARLLGPLVADDVLAFTSLRDGNSDIFLLDVGRGLQVNLTRSRSIETNPAWSTDGRLAFVSDRGGNFDVYVWDLLSGSIQVVSHSDYIDNYPTWSVDGRLAFATENPASVSIMVLGAAHQGQAEDVLTMQNARDLAWNGGRLALVSFNYGTSTIFLLDPQNGARHMERLNGSNAAGVRNDSPAWSPDGRWLAFTRWVGSNPEIFVRDERSGAERNITNHHQVDDHPAWSPDGRYLVFESYRDGNAEIYMIDITSGTLRNLTQHAANDYAPAWRP